MLTEHDIAHVSRTAHILPDLDTQTSLLELRIRNMLEELKVWIIDEFGDLIAEIPDPTQMPLRFLDILSELGILCADREALLFMIKI